MLALYYFDIAADFLDCFTHWNVIVFQTSSNQFYYLIMSNYVFFPGVTIVCPKDVELMLPLGASEMRLPLSKLGNMDLKNVISEPAGVFNGTYKFKSSPTTTTAVRLLYSNGYSTSSCYFRVNVTGKFPN